MSTTPNRSDWAVIIGRFQPFHAGHAKMLEAALAVGQRVLVVLGSANRASSHKNPFSWQERRDIILATLSQAQRARVEFAPLRDRFNLDAWVEDLQSLLGQVAASVQTTKAPPSVTLVGHFKDRSSDYLHHFPDWVLYEVENHLQLNATQIRSILYQAILDEKPVQLPEGTVHPATQAWLREWQTSDAAKRVAREWAFVRSDNARWDAAPYPPIWTTVDVLVSWRNQILLIQRKSPPGEGLWALPGGYLEQHELVYTAALRELEEETGLRLSSKDARQCLKAVRVFDHPERSIKGRIITHAHYFLLDSLSLDEAPNVQAADDANDAVWLDLAELDAYETRLHDDHYHIIRMLLKR